ncbi:hypothetical protein GALMADRAFT_140610 [Galerina marginata CBS 339.88]|uniref:F-box domain-containing protein n=1 Tax=Galerina marginata (strain CBS 339.88) TaxID=685588 RepID=A0A067SVW1_GALM3|nr:hypothetical protein GALMADRAFT_140610 [Galerina marginata CBS 339.88]
MSANAAGNFLNSGTGDAAAKESPVSSLFLSNRAPTDCEVSAIKQTIREGEEEVGTLQRILSEPTTPADQKAIQSRLSHLDQLLKSHRALLSSIRFLPTELIALIFLHFTAENKDPVNNPSPWILCLTSLTTRLENVISALILRLSGDFPLSFYLKSMIPRRLYTPILELLLSQAERWENVSLSISGITSYGLLVIQRRLPLLRCLKLNIHSTSTISLDMFKVAPNLREVSLVSQAGLQIDLPWNQLTSYEEEATTVDRLCLALQSGSDTLQNIRFTTNRVASYRHSGVTQNIIVLPRLEALTLESFHYYEGPLGILDKLTLPALQNMVFRSFSAKDFGLQTQNLIKRSSCVIQSLTFHEVPNHACLIPILELTPCLTSLFINDPNTTVIHELLCLRNGRTWTLLPNLRSLKIHLTANRTNPEDLQRLALARCDLSTIDVKDRTNMKVLETFELSFAMNINGPLDTLPCLTGFPEILENL